MFIKHLLVRFLLIFSLLVPRTHPVDSYIDHVEESVVRVTSSQPAGDSAFRESSVCTGFVVAPHRVLTAAHCVPEQMNGDVIFALDGDTNAVTLLKIDRQLDLALFQDVTVNRPALQFRAGPLYRFEKVNGIGYAYGWNHLLVTINYVVQQDVVPFPGWPAMTIVQNLLVGGMSGGPLIDADGLVVGINERTDPEAGLGYVIGPTLMQAFLLGT